MSDYARLRDLTAGIDQSSDDGFQRVMERLAVELSGAGGDAVLQVSVGADEGEEQRRYFTAARGQAGGTRVESPDVEVMIAPDTFWRLADGGYSPVEAMCQGRLRLCGDEALAKRLLRHLGGPDGRVDCG